MRWATAPLFSPRIDMPASIHQEVRVQAEGLVTANQAGKHVFASADNFADGETC
jgi:hypothetical protein